MARTAAMRYRLGMSLFLRAVRPMLRALPRTLAVNLLSVAWLPYFTWVLTPADLGLLGLALCGARALEVLGTLRIDAALSRIMAQNPQAERLRVRNAAITLAGTNHLAMIAAAAALAWVVPAYAWVFVSAAVLATLRLPATLFGAEPADTWMRSKRSILDTGRNLIGILVMVVLISRLGMAWEGRVVALIVAEAFAALICWFVLSDIGRRYRPQVGQGMVLGLASAGAPLALQSFGVWALDNADRLVALGAFTLTEVGYYVAAGRIAMVLLAANRAFAMSLVPLLHELAVAGDVGAMARLHAGFALAGMVLSAAVAVLFLHYSHVVLGPRFQDAASIIAVVVASAGLHAAFQLGRQIRALYRPHPLGGLMTFAGVAVQLGVTFVLLEPLGPLAPAAGDVAGRVAAAVTIVWAIYSMVGRMPVVASPRPRAAVEPRDNHL